MEITSIPGPIGEFARFICDLEQEQIQSGIVYVSQSTIDYVKQALEDAPAHVLWNQIAFFYAFALSPSAKEKVPPELAQRIQMEFAKMVELTKRDDQWASTKSDSAYLGPFLDQLRAYVTQTYLQTDLQANPSYAFHDEGHSERIIDYLQQLASLHSPEHRLNPTEYFLVVAGAWVHDIGFAQGSCRENHHKGAKAVILSDGFIQSYLLNDETAIEVVVRLAFNHSSKVDVTSIQDWNWTIELVRGQPHCVRVRHLSCLLRLADALDIDHRRAIRNPALLEKLKSDNPVSYAYHLCHQRIQSVRVNPQTRQIDIQAIVQTRVDKDRIRRFINERLKLRREVKVLVPYLWPSIPGLKDELNLDIQPSSQSPRLPANIVNEDFLSGK